MLWGGFIFLRLIYVIDAYTRLFFLARRYVLLGSPIFGFVGFGLVGLGGWVVG
jgi:hypothetical protein